MEDDIKAMSEINRAKIRGWQSSNHRKTMIERNLEDSTITDPKERERVYWQDDPCYTD